ncbi:MAG: hypothetical protein GTO18_00255 [Anaerolineales bacterium]|nr:hypothetical protein [Anaerolineales bacterium]
MADDLRCPECGGENLFYREVHKETSMAIRIVNYVGGFLFIGMGITVATTSGGILPLVAIIIGCIILWISITGRIKTVLSAFRFKCSDCGHEWEVEKAGMSYARKWKELPPGDWMKLRPGISEPGLSR